jgi:adenine-specific DNA-methyltransferase
MTKPAPAKTITALTHDDATRKNIPGAELAAVMRDEEKAVKTLRYPRNPDLAPQLVWRGKDAQDGEDLLVRAQPLYIQEKIHPKPLKTRLKAEINRQAWETLMSATSRPFPKPKSGRIAVKVINHLGDEVMKVFRV